MKAGSRHAQADIGRLVDTSRGTIQVREDGPANDATPLLLIHALAGSIQAWDPVVEPLARGRRVVRVDLLGHGGSDKPDNGYTMAGQAAMACEVLDQLDIDRVVAVGHSGGGDIVVAMIEHHPARVAAAVLLATPPNLTYVHLPVTARLFSAPLLGGVLWKLTTDKMIRGGLAKTFAAGFGSVPDVFVSDLQRMTHRAYVKARAEVEGYRKQQDLTVRVGDAGVPLMIIFGDEDQWVDPLAADGWANTTSARIEILPGVGHTPMIEAPAQTAVLVSDFALSVAGVDGRVEQ